MSIFLNREAVDVNCGTQDVDEDLELDDGISSEEEDDPLFRRIRKRTHSALDSDSELDDHTSTSTHKQSKRDGSEKNETLVTELVDEVKKSNKLLLSLANRVKKTEKRLKEVENQLKKNSDSSPGSTPKRTSSRKRDVPDEVRVSTSNFGQK